jgi:hypothetical protein
LDALFWELVLSVLLRAWLDLLPSVRSVPNYTNGQYAFQKFWALNWIRRRTFSSIVTHATSSSLVAFSFRC